MIVACLVACLSIISSGAARQASADSDQTIVWMWVDRHGALAFTDDPKRIPSAYRYAAGRKPVDWPRVTIDQVGSDQRRALLGARVKALRATPPASRVCTGPD